MLNVHYQCVEVVADQGSVVDDVSLEDNEEEEESQHHIAQVTEDVVECTAWDSGEESVTVTLSTEPFLIIHM